MENTFFLSPIFDGEDKTSPLKNRIRNNYRHIRKWARRTHTNCFRIYDREIREYPLAIDYYDGKFCIHYFRSSLENIEILADLSKEVVLALESLFHASEASIFWRTRVKREKKEQYEKVSNSCDFFSVLEYGQIFKVNLQDYLDTGLFLDHRETRQIVAREATGKHLLNLFSYTCAFSVHAAVRGALSTTSVDMSNTYAAWGRDNFNLNNISPKNHIIIREDYAKFLEDAVTKNSQYDVIIIDPPTISRSKKMLRMFDVQWDYPDLLNAALKIMSKDGCIFFSTNSRKFSFDPQAISSCHILEITQKTQPLDFHNKTHRCWKITNSL